MELNKLQKYIADTQRQMETPFRSGAEIMLALIEEIGEISREVALLEQIGSKTEWHKSPSRSNLAEEMIHAINLLLTLANQFDLDLSQAYVEYLEKGDECLISEDQNE